MKRRARRRPFPPLKGGGIRWGPTTAVPDHPCAIPCTSLNVVMVAVAICSADPILRNRLERLLGGTPAIEIIGVAEDVQALSRLIEQDRVDVLLVDRLPQSTDQP